MHFYRMIVKLTFHICKMNIDIIYFSFFTALYQLIDPSKKILLAKYLKQYTSTLSHGQRQKWVVNVLKGCFKMD